MITDQQLLRQFVERGAQQAFAALVRRHVDMVYAAAVRQVRNRHLAEDVTQAVFIVLHRKASRLLRMATIAGWLLKVTRYAAVDAMRKQARQNRHERAAAKHESASDRGMDDWEELLPELDEALAKLGRADRDAVVLRYFEKATFPEIGQALGMNEDAARKRVTRAVQKLRGLLAKQGVAVTLAGLTAALAAQSAVAAPSHVTAAAVSIGAGAVASAGAGVSIAKGAMSIMAIAKAKTMTAAAAAMIFAAVTSIVFLAQMANRKPTGVVADTSASPVAAFIPGADHGLEGPWRFTYLREHGLEVPERRLREMSLLVTSDEFILRRADGTGLPADYWLDADRQWIELKPKTNDATYRGSCLVENDTLRITLAVSGAVVEQRGPDEPLWDPIIEMVLERRVVRQEDYVFDFVVRHGELLDIERLAVLPAPADLPQDLSEWYVATSSARRAATGRWTTPQERLESDEPVRHADVLMAFLGGAQGRFPPPGFVGLINPALRTDRAEAEMWQRPQAAQRLHITGRQHNVFLDSSTPVWLVETFPSSNVPDEGRVMSRLGLLRIVRVENEPAGTMHVQVMRLPGASAQ